MQKCLTLVPAYGRDYTSADAARKDWESAKDFRIADIGCPWNGSYVGFTQQSELVADGYESVKIRFNQLSDFVLVELA